MLTFVALLVLACSPGSTIPTASSVGSFTPPISPGTPSPTPALPTPGLPPAETPTAEPPSVETPTASEALCRERLGAEEHGAIGRKLSAAEREALRPILAVPTELLTFYLFTDGVHDMSCYTYNREYGGGMAAETLLSSHEYSIDDDQAVVIGAGGTSDLSFGGWLWGVAGPSVERIEVTAREDATNAGEVAETTLEDGYFFSIFSGACCVGNLVRVVAFDASGDEIYRSE